MIPLQDHNPFPTRPTATLALIGLTCIVYLGLKSILFSPTRMIHAVNLLMLSNSSIPGIDQAYTLLTSLLMHLETGHLLANILFLWLFGASIEGALGAFKMLMIFFIGGVLAWLPELYLSPMENISLIGASGGVAALAGAYLLLYPLGKMDVFMPVQLARPIIAIPIVYVMAAWALMQLYGALTYEIGARNSTAHIAHLAGLSIGALLALPFWLKLGARAYWQRTSFRPPNPKARYKLPTERDAALMRDAPRAKQNC